MNLDAPFEAWVFQSSNMIMTMMRRLGYQTQVHRKSELCIYFYFDQSLVATRKEIVIYCLQCENHLFYKTKPSMTELFQQTSCESWSNGDFANPFNQCRHQTHNTYSTSLEEPPCHVRHQPDLKTFDLEVLDGAQPGEGAPYHRRFWLSVYCNNKST